jgi:hypothetical protein
MARATASTIGPGWPDSVRTGAPKLTGEVSCHAHKLAAVATPAHRGTLNLVDFMRRVDADVAAAKTRRTLDRDSETRVNIVEQYNG